MQKQQRDHVSASPLTWKQIQNFYSETSFKMKRIDGTSVLTDAGNYILALLSPVCTVEDLNEKLRLNALDERLWLVIGRERDWRPVLSNSSNLKTNVGGYFLEQRDFIATLTRWAGRHSNVHDDFYAMPISNTSAQLYFSHEDEVLIYVA
jgi:hypothetical protein